MVFRIVLFVLGWVVAAAGGILLRDPDFLGMPRDLIGAALGSSFGAAGILLLDAAVTRYRVRLAAIVGAWILFIAVVEFNGVWQQWFANGGLDWSTVALAGGVAAGGGFCLWFGLKPRSRREGHSESEVLEETARDQSEVLAYLRLGGATGVVGSLLCFLGAAFLATVSEDDESLGPLVLGAAVFILPLALLTCRGNRIASTIHIGVIGYATLETLSEVALDPKLPVVFLSGYVAIRACWATFRYHELKLSAGSPPSRLLKETLGWSAAGCAGLIVVVAGTALAVRLSYGFAVNGKLRALQRAGQPVSLEGLAKWSQRNNMREAPDDLQKAIEVIGEVTKASPTLASWLRKGLPPSGKPLSSESREVLGQFIPQVGVSLDLLTRQLDEGQYRFLSDFSAGPRLPVLHLSALRTSYLIRTRQALAAIEDGQTKEAFQHLEDALAIAGSVAKEPLAVSQLVRFAGITATCNTLEKLLNLRELPVDLAVSLTAALTRHSGEDAVKVALLGERCFTIDLMRAPVSKLSAVWNEYADGDEPSNAFEISLQIYQFCGLLNRDLAYYLDRMAEYERACQRPLRGRLSAARSVNEAIKDDEKNPDVFKRHIVSGMMLPSLFRLFLREGPATAKLLLAKTALAVESSRSRNGEFPAALSDLVPKDMPELPADPFDKNALRYRREANGYLLYSVGPDGRDDNGRELFTPNSAAPDLPQIGDIPFRVSRSSSPPKPRPGNAAD